jgi:hypothetical protein
MLDANSLVRDGQNRFHAVFRTEDRRSSSALQPRTCPRRPRATVESAAPGRSPVCPPWNFRAPVSDVERVTVVRSEEILTEVVIPMAD